jgi:hypothetical protein
MGTDADLDNRILTLPQSEYADLVRQNREDAAEEYWNRARRYPAKLWKTDGYVDYILSEKPDRDFDRCATDWEKEWSTLYTWSSGNFIPVVNSDLKVTGHYGSVKGGSFTNLIVTRAGLPPEDVRQQGSPYETYYTNDLGALLKSGVRAFVFDRNKTPPPGYVVCDALTTEHVHWVETLMDGEVFRVRQVTNKGFVEPEPVTPYDLYMIAKVLVNFGMNTGIKLADSLSAKATAWRKAPELLSGPTEKVAQQVTAARPPIPAGIISAEGQLPLVRIGRLGQPGNLNGYIRVVGNDVIYKVEAIVFDGAKSAAEEGAVRLARQAHREMLVRAAREAQKLGQKQFKLFGESTSPAFQKSADDLAKAVGVPGSGRRFPGPLPDRPDYEVILDVEKLLKSNP